jgi:hypothetical protein
MKKIIPAIIAFSLIFSVLLNSFPQKSMAQTSFGATIGKATGAAAACFATMYIKELLGKELLSKAEGYAKQIKKPENYTAAALSVPVFDFSAIITIDTSAAKTQISQTMIKSKDCARDVLAKILIDWLVDQIVNWIQGGGEPKFVTNWEDFLSDAFQAGVGTVINESNFRFLCSPFRAQVQLSLLPVKRFPQRVECTLDQVVENIEDFYNDFSKGGWIAYNQMWQPQNNYYGQILLFYDEAMMRGLAAKEAAEDEAAAGRGFLSVKRCRAYDTGAYADCIEANPDNAAACKKDDFCYSWETHTPGYVVGEAAAEAITSDIKWAYNIKSWVAAIINAALNRLITEGLAYMKGSQEEYDTEKGDLAPYPYDKKKKRYEPINYGGIDFTDMDKSATENVVENYEKFLADSNDILTSKQTSLAAVNSLIGVLNDLKDKGCPGFLQDDLDKAQKAQSDLQSDISKIQNLINEIQPNLDEARAAAKAGDNEKGNNQRLAVLEKYNEFISEKYPMILAGQYAGFTKSVAQEDAAEWSNKLANAQNQLNQCQTTATTTVETVETVAF